MADIREGHAWLASKVAAGALPASEELVPQLKKMLMAVKALQDAPSSRFSEEEKKILSAHAGDMIRASKAITSDNYAAPLKAMLDAAACLLDSATR